MRVVDRATFLTLPPGTLYCKGKQWYFEGLNAKHGNSGSTDWYAADPAWVEGEDGMQCMMRLEEMLADGVSYPMQASICRDGFFDADALFLVFERADLEVLRGWIDTALALPDPPHRTPSRRPPCPP